MEEVQPKKNLTFEDYDLVSAHYDDARRPVGLQSFKKHLRSSVYKDKHKILDIGTGTGNYLQHLSSECEEIIGLEQSEGMAKKCSDKIEKQGITNAKTIVGSAFEMPFGDAEFTAAITTQTIHHFNGKENVKKVFQEAARVLQKDGLLIINHSDFRQSYTCWWCHFLPSFKPFARKRFLSSEVLIEIASPWFELVQIDVIKEPLCRQDLFENPRYIISDQGRLTDSSWKCASEAEVNNAIAQIKLLFSEKKWDTWFETIMEDIEEYGQSNNVVLRRK